MILANQGIISAQVVLRPADGRVIPPNAAITAETLASYLPSEEAAARVRGFFAGSGFTVEGLVGISFAISGTAELFQSLFKVELHREDGGVKAARGDGPADYGLPLDSLPEEIRACTSAVTFTPPPDFGPTSFM